MKLEVRCCCQPQKLLGWLEVDSQYVQRGVTMQFVIPPTRWSDAVSTTPPEIVSLPVEAFGTYDAEGRPIKHLALKSEETPIEVLRRIPSFVENRHG